MTPTANRSVTARMAVQRASPLARSNRSAASSPAPERKLAQMISSGSTGNPRACSASR